MKSGVENNLTLSIETAVEGGSLSILENGNEIDAWTGESKISKAEEVLEQIQNLFEKNSVKKESIRLITVSNGPGSSTGVKIGLSMAKGLARAFNCRIIEVSVLQALAAKGKPATRGRILTAIPIGKNLIAWQSFEDNILDSSEYYSAAQVSDFGKFSSELASGKYSGVVLHNSIFQLFKNLFKNSNDFLIQDVIDGGANMAESIGKGGIKKHKAASDNDVKL